ncbi:MAG: nitroreductase [Francisellaceae bacterium]|jgi:nitroreductase
MKFIKKLVFNSYKKIELELLCFVDYLKFKKSFTNDSDKKDVSSLKSWILQDKHRIEKGLSLPSPRFGFGRDVLLRLHKNLQDYQAVHEKDYVYYIGVGAYRAYVEYHTAYHEQLPLEITHLIDIYRDDFSVEQTSVVGLKNISQSTMNSSTLSDFFESRSSCRKFNKDSLIADETLYEAIRMAKQSPSVCNRQPWRVHFFSEGKVKKILSLQNGNVGFGDEVPYVAVVTCDLKAFYAPSERNQAFVDGGLFSMSFLLALHSLDIQACALNWCDTFGVRRKFSKLGFVDNSEVVIMIIAFGYAENGATCAKSPRLDTENFLKFHWNKAK